MLFPNKSKPHKVWIFFFISLIIIPLSFSLLIFSVKATASYQWIQNNSFEPYINYFEYGDAESGEYNTGVLYGNYSGTGDFSTTQNRNGIYAYRLTTSGQILWYNLTNPIMGADIKESYFYAKYILNNDNVNVTVYYSDNSGDCHSYAIIASAWTKIDFKSIIDVSRWVTAISWKNEQAGNSATYDDMILYRSDQLTQNSITYDTTPWYVLSLTGSAGLTDDISHFGDYSCVFTPSLQHYPYLVQSINNLDSDLVTTFSVWCSNGGDDSYLEMGFYYDDGSTSSVQKLISGSSMTLYNFFSAIESNKVIVGIFIHVIDYSNTGWLYIDDVSLIATTIYVPFSVTLFDFTLTPQPINYVSDIVYEGFLRTNNIKTGFRAYTEISYVFTGTVYGNINGTFTVTSSYATSGGQISLGEFTFNIATRSSKTDFNESFLIQINDNVTIRSYSVLANWIAVSSTTPSTTRTTMQNQFFEWFPVLVIFMIFTIPATVYLGVGGFIGGFSMGCIVAVWMGLAPTWLLAMAVLTDITVLYTAVPSVRNEINERTVTTVKAVRSTFSRGKNKVSDKLEDIEGD